MKYMSSAALITSTPLTSPTNSTTYLRNRPRFMRTARMEWQGPGTALLPAMVTPPGPQGQAACASFDQLIGRRDDLFRDMESDFLGGSHIDDELDLLGLHDGQVRRLGSLEDALDIARDLAKLA